MSQKTISVKPAVWLKVLSQAGYKTDNLQKILDQAASDPSCRALKFVLRGNEPYLSKWVSRRKRTENAVSIAHCPEPADANPGRSASAEPFRGVYAAGRITQRFFKKSRAQFLARLKQPISAEEKTKLEAQLAHLRERAIASGHRSSAQLKRSVAPQASQAQAAPAQPARNGRRMFNGLPVLERQKFKSLADEACFTKTITAMAAVIPGERVEYQWWEVDGMPADLAEAIKTLSEPSPVPAAPQPGEPDPASVAPNRPEPEG